jgi:hypothetical protein
VIFLRKKCYILKDMEKNRMMITAKHTAVKRRLSGAACFGVRGLLAALTLLSLAGCPVFDLGDVEDEWTKESGTFKIRPTEGDFYTVYAQKLAEGNHCQIFVDKNENKVSISAARSIAAKFDNDIYPKITGIFGDYLAMGYDVDGNGKLILLLVDIKDGYTGLGGFVAGYFDATHMLLTNPNSNRADMLIIDINPQDPGSPGFYTTIAHELQHLINYAGHDGYPQELWLNEGLSAAAEYLYGGEQQGRINYFNNAGKNDASSNTIVYGNNFFVWNGYWEKEKRDLLANYATAYLFFRWLGIQGGSEIYAAMARSPYRDYRAVTMAAHEQISGITETDDAKIWDQLLSSWMIANLVNAPTGLYGYGGKIDTTVSVFNEESIQNVSLFPGEGVYSSLEGKSLTNGEVAGSGPHIKYVGIGGTQQNLMIISSSPYSGNVLLTYNANPDLIFDSVTGEAKNSSEQGYIMSYSGEPSLGPASPAPVGSSGAAPAGTASAGAVPAGARSALPSGSLPASYPIGIHDLETLRSAERAGTR